MRRLLSVVALLLAGCTTTDPGSPTAGSSPTSTESSATATTTSPAGATRPRNVDVAAVDICGLVGSLPRGDFGLDTDRPPTGGDSSLFPGSKDCFANGIQNNLGLLVVAVVDEGAAEFAESANAEVDQTEAGGFPLYILTPPNPGNCVGMLDVNDGQMIYFSYAVGSSDSGPSTPQAALCLRIPDIAMAIVARI